MRHDLKAKPSDFQVGEQFLLKLNKVPTSLSKKLYDKYSGPYFIRTKVPNDTYEIVDCTTNKPHKSLLNASQLRHYYDPDDYRTPPDIITPEEAADDLMPTAEAYPQEPVVLPQPRNEGPNTDPPPAVQERKALTTKTDDRSFTDKMDNSHVTQRTTTGGDKCFYAAEKLMKAEWQDGVLGEMGGRLCFLMATARKYLPFSNAGILDYSHETGQKTKKEISLFPTY